MPMSVTLLPSEAHLIPTVPVCFQVVVFQQFDIQAGTAIFKDRTIYLKRKLLC